MKAGDLVNHHPACFDKPWTNGLIVETRSEVFEHSIEGLQVRTQHMFFWPAQTLCWTEERLLEVRVV